MELYDHYRAINLKGFCRILDAYGIISWKSSHPVRDALTIGQLLERGALRRKLKENFVKARDGDATLKKAITLDWMNKELLFEMRPSKPNRVVLTLSAKEPSA